jgi:threonine aldolase
MHPVFQTVNPRLFASDNASPVHPRVMEALAAANSGHVHSYGDDPYTEAALEAFDRVFGRPVHTFFVFNGTGANGTALSGFLRPYQSVICAETAHMYYDECGAPEHLTGSKLQPVASADGKIRPEQLEPFMAFHGVMHHAQPTALSITQVTEMGTVYTPQEIRALSDFAHAHGMKVHMDGARIANAVAALGCDIADITWKAGVDALSFGGTKNGMMFGEAVVLFDDDYAQAFPYVRKNSAQLASKMRYIAAQFLAAFEDDLWLKTASHANALCKKLVDGLTALPGASLAASPDANELFLQLPKALIAPLMEASFFYMWDEAQNVIRLVTSWDTQEADVEIFLDTARRLASAE